MFDGKQLAHELLATTREFIERSLDPVRKQLADLRGEVAEIEKKRDAMRLEVERLADLIKSIPAGPKGERGEKGETGDRGEKGEPGRDGRDGLPGPAGRDGVDGKDGADGINGKDGANGLDGKDGAAGRDGVDGKDGAAGRDGFSLDDFDAELTDGRILLLKFAAAGVEWKREFVLPIPVDAGVYRSETKYVGGEAVSYGGSLWIAQRASTGERPDSGSGAWRLAVKKGRDGKDGAPGLKGEKGDPGSPGRDLTQLGLDGRKW